MSGTLLHDNLDKLRFTLTNSDDELPYDGTSHAVLTDLKFTLADLTEKVEIEGVTNDTVAPIVITSTAHGLTTGDLICLFFVVGNKPANGPQQITGINANSFSLDGTTGVGDWKDTTDDQDPPIWCPVVDDVSDVPVSHDANGMYKLEIDWDVNIVSGRSYLGYLVSDSAKLTRYVQIQGAAPLI